MNIKRIVGCLAGLIGTLIPFATQGHVPASQEFNQGIRQYQRQQEAQVVIERLINRGVMDPVSASELVMSLTEIELKALADALTNKMVSQSKHDVIPV